MSQPTAVHAPTGPTPTPAALFRTFVGLSLSGFGGVLPFAHRTIVDRHRWLSDREFLDILALGQFLPGPNILNVAIVIGRRFAGWRGALAALAGFTVAPFVTMVILGGLYIRYGEVPHVHATIGGVACGAAGLIIATGIRMARPLWPTWWQLALALVVFLAIGIARFPLVAVLAVMIPTAVLVSFRQHR